MAESQRDLTPLAPLGQARLRSGPVRAQRPVYVDLMPPCNNACPAGENIQGWLGHARVGEDEEAWRLLTDDNPFAAIHGRVCYHPCETSCNRKELDGAVSIHAVERYLGDLANERDWQFRGPEVRSGRRVLVVGAGPSGLSAAYHLARLGHDVVVRDNGPQPGGMMRYGIPAYRLPRDVLDAEVARIEAMGVVFEQEHRVTNLEAERDGFDAVFVAVGAHLSKRVDIPNGDAGRILDAVSFLRGVESGEQPALSGKVAVYGGGNTAMDAARVARRLGADDSIIVYRRTRDQMPAHEEEAADAEAEGIRINWLRTISSMGEARPDRRDPGARRGRPATRHRTVRDAGGRHRHPRPGSGERHQLPERRARSRSRRRRGPGRPDHAHDRGPGRVRGRRRGAERANGHGRGGHGKKAARSIDAYLRGDAFGPHPKHPLAPFESLNLWYFGDHDRRQQAELEPATRVGDFHEVVAGLSPDEAHFEAGRCLSCGNCFECDGCFGACPEDAVIRLGKGNRYAFDYDLCTGCSACYRQCPVHAIEMVPESQSSTRCHRAAPQGTGSRGTAVIPVPEV